MKGGCAHYCCLVGRRYSRVDPFAILWKVVRTGLKHT